MFHFESTSYFLALKNLKGLFQEPSARLLMRKADEEVLDGGQSFKVLGKNVGEREAPLGKGKERDEQ